MRLVCLQEEGAMDDGCRWRWKEAPVVQARVSAFPLLPARLWLLSSASSMDKLSIRHQAIAKLAVLRGDGPRRKRG